MTSPPQRTAWNAEVDKLKNRLSVLSQSSLDDEDQRRLRELGMEQHKSEEGSGPGDANVYDEAVTAGRSDFDLAREREDKTDEMRYDFFFYGTLMHPLILARVLGHQDPTLEFQDAILLGYVRHCVKGADYPAILPALESSKLMKRKLQDDEACVRGTYVRGLTRVDVISLDAFEGDEYARVWIRGSMGTPSPFVSPAILTPGSDALLFANETPPILSPGGGGGGLPPHPRSAPADGSSTYFDDLPVRPQIITLGPISKLSVVLAGLTVGASTGSSSSSDLGEQIVKPDVSVERAKNGLQAGEEGFNEVLAWVYVWRWDVGMLEREIWDLRAFLAEKSHRWTGEHEQSHGAHGGTSAEEISAVYEDVNEARRRLIQAGRSV